VGTRERKLGGKELYFQETQPATTTTTTATTTNNNNNSSNEELAHF